jgi:hypothetical protein
MTEHWQFIEGRYYHEIIPGAPLVLAQGGAGWMVRLGAESLPESFATPEDAAQAALEFARRRLYEALAGVTH